jgi:hypothetical protein
VRLPRLSQAKPGDKDLTTCNLSSGDPRDWTASR